MPRQFVPNEAPEHGLFLGDKLPTTRQFIQDEALELQKEFPMLRQFVQDEVPEHMLLVEDELQMTRHFVQDKAPER
jgi:hypothetical protein